MPKKASAYLGRSVVVLCLFALGCLACGDGLWFLESAAYWIPCFVALSALSAVCCVYGRSRRWAAIAVVSLALYSGLLAGAVTPWPFYTPPSHAPNLRVLTANVYDQQHDATALLNLIRDVNPDVVLLQEVNNEWQHLLAPLESTYPHHRISERYPGGGSDLALYWRPPSGPAETLAEADIPGVAVDLTVNGTVIRIVNAHTAAPFSPRRAQRYRAQMAALTRMAHDTTQPFVLAGDLNSSVWSPLYRKLVQGTTLRNARRGFGLLGTWPSFFGPFRTPLDHLLVSPEIEVVDCRVGCGIGSDHRPLIADLYIAPQ